MENSLSRINLPEAQEKTHAHERKSNEYPTTTLSTASFVQLFSQRILKNPQILWRNDKLFDPPCYLGSIQANENAHENTVVTLADIYGGEFIGTNGGSARMTCLNEYQYKGIGLTPLYFSPPHHKKDRWHHTGTLSLDEGVREVIWSQILGKALPRGTAQAIALYSDVEDARKSEAKIIFVRKFAIRPAHFIQNLHFPWSIDEKTNTSVDFYRTLQNVRLLKKSFTELNAEISHQKLFEQISIAHSDQISAAFVRRVFHGSLSTSNVKLDGGWLDFGATDVNHGYRRRTGAPQPLGPDYWDQFSQVFGIIESLARSVNKFVETFGGNDLVDIVRTRHIFQKNLNARLALEFFKLIGFEETCADLITSDALTRFHLACINVYKYRAHQQFVWLGQFDELANGRRATEYSGQLDLNREIVNSLGCIFSSMTPPQLRPTEELYLSIKDIVSQILVNPKRSKSITPISLMRKSNLRNASLGFLARDNIDKCVATFANDPHRLLSYMNRTIRRGERILAY